MFPTSTHPRARTYGRIHVPAAVGARAALAPARQGSSWRSPRCSRAAARPRPPDLQVRTGRHPRDVRAVRARRRLPGARSRRRSDAALRYWGGTWEHLAGVTSPSPARPRSVRRRAVSRLLPGRRSGSPRSTPASARSTASSRRSSSTRSVTRSSAIRTTPIHAGWSWSRSPRSSPGASATTPTGRSRPVPSTRASGAIHSARLRAAAPSGIVNRSSIARCGSSQSPACTGPTWMTVLRGATSQWNRSRGVSRPIGPAPLAAGRDARDGGEVRLDERRGRGRDRGTARRGAAVEPDARREEVARPGRTGRRRRSRTPRARRAARTRTSGVSQTRLGAGTFRLREEDRRRREAARRGGPRTPARCASGVAKRGSPASQSSGTSAAGARQDRLGPRAPCASRSPAAPTLRGQRQEDVVLHHRERTTRRAPRRRAHAWANQSAAPWSMSHRCPCQTSRFGLRGVRSMFATNASKATTSDASGRRGRPARRRGRT